MIYRTLGKTNLKVSEVGMGTWQLADDPNCWVGANLKESLASLSRFTELGGNFIDTAWIYGYSDTDRKHRSHELIGQFLKESGQRDKLLIASKVPPKNMHWPAKPDISLSEVFPSSWIESCVDDTLRSLGVDTIELMQFHIWQDYFVTEESWKNTIQKITKSGKVRFWGISTNDYQPENCLKTLDTGLISTVQFIFNIFHQQPTEKLLPYAVKNNIGLIARVPLDEGGLTGKYSIKTQFSEGDFRRHYFNTERLPELIKRTDNLKKLLSSNQTLSEFALRYVLSFTEVSTVIPGMRKIDFVNSNTSVSDGKTLSSQLLSELKLHSWERNFYV